MLAAFWVTMVVVDWRYFVIFYLPSYYLGWVLTYAHTYVLHYGAQPGNYYANSVSSYHRLYNLIFFYNGYHQEHHWDPKAHWTRMHAVHEEILPQMIANRTRILRGPHITAFLEDWLRSRRELRAGRQRNRGLVVAGPVRGLDGEGPLDGQQGAEEDGHPEQPGGGARQNAAVGIEGEGEQHEDEQGKGRHLIGRHP